MGTIQHNAILASTWDEDKIERIEKWIATLSEHEQKHFLISRATVNGYRTVICIPDGSKEGWADSDQGDDRRAMFLNELRKSYHWDWIEVSYGELGYYVENSPEGDKEEYNEEDEDEQN